MHTFKGLGEFRNNLKNQHLKFKCLQDHAPTKSVKLPDATWFGKVINCERMISHIKNVTKTKIIIPSRIKKQADLEAK